MRVALQMDPFDQIRWSTDSTVFLGREAQKRGATLMCYEPVHLSWSSTGVYARGRLIRFLETEPFFKAGELQIFDLKTFDVLLIRQDPPFDMAYITATHILEHLLPKVRVVNHPVSLRNAPEKLLCTHFPDLMPATLISADRDALKAFYDQQGSIVLKPLFAHGGYGVTYFKPQDPNMPIVADLLVASTKAPIVAQAFVPEVIEGDRRLFFIHGTWIGGFKRVPPVGHIRSNTVLGGHAEAVDFSDHERAVANRLGPFFKERGLHLVGLDMIGAYVTEINVTSPTGMVGLKALCGIDAAVLFWDGLHTDVLSS